MGPLGPGAHKVLFEPSEHFWRIWGLILNLTSPLLPSCWGFSFVLGVAYLFLVGSNILLSMAVPQQGAILELSQEKMSIRLCVLLSCLALSHGQHHCRHEYRLLSLVAASPGLATSKLRWADQQGWPSSFFFPP